MTAVLLPADGFRDFVERHVLPRQALLDGPEESPGRWTALADLVAEDGRMLRAAHRGLVESGQPEKAAANYLAGWIGGGLAQQVGLVLAGAGAGVVVDQRVRWRMVPAGWPDRIDLGGCAVVVPTGHPWAGGPAVEVVADEAEVRGRVGAGLADLLTPLVETCAGLARVSRTSLWSEVADGIGGATAGVHLARPDRAIPVLERLLAVPGMPWRRCPALWAAESRAGRLVVTQRGGCCLAYTAAPAQEPADDATDDGSDRTGALRVEGGDADPRAAFAARFPPEPGIPAYCADCRFRAPEDVEERQVFWTELQWGAR